MVTAVRLAQYALTASIDNGVTGTPVSGSYQYREGTAVPYQYSAGAQVLVVKLDGNSVPAFGTILMDRDHFLQATASSPFDIRGRWRFWIKQEHHDLYISFSGEKTNGVADLLDDPDSYWWDNFGMKGRIGDYKVASTKVSIKITKIEYPIGSFALSGNFTSTATMTGTYIYYYGDPAFKSEGTWTASRII
jgi:hypothetical protein